MAKSKVVSIADAMTHVSDGMTIMVPGFVTCGIPDTLIKAIIANGYKDLDIISNNAGVPGHGVGLFISENRVKHITCSHIGLNKDAVAQVVAGEINVTFTPQGTFCERIRAGGSGIGGIEKGN